MRRILGPKVLDDLKLAPSYTGRFNTEINKRNKCVKDNIAPIAKTKISPLYMSMKSQKLQCPNYTNCTIFKNTAGCHSLVATLLKRLGHQMAILLKAYEIIYYFMYMPVVCKTKVSIKFLLLSLNTLANQTLVP
jgi:hypothetical protein